MDDFSLGGGFAPAAEAEWRVLAGKALGDAPFDALRTALHEGLKTEPIYTKQSRASPLPTTRGWSIIQPLSGRTLSEVQTQLEDDLVNGADALSLNFDEGLEVQNQADLQYLLGSDMPYFVSAGASVADAALVVAATEHASERYPIAGSAGFDPLTAFAISGQIPADRASLFADYADAAFFLRRHVPSFVPFLASGSAWNKAGGSAVQELAFTLAAGAAYWRSLTQAGMSVSEGASCIGFSLSTSADIFLTISSFRAMRLLWARALAAAGAQSAPDLLLLATMSPRILSAYDPHVNLLRGTAAAFGAAIGGATGVEVLPFDTAAGGATLFSRRLARNTSLILQHESQLSAVADAAAGSAYVETLTDDLAAAAWALFRGVEARGGLMAALETGFVQDELRRTADERERAIAQREDKITGVSVFPNLSEAAPLPEGQAAVHGNERPLTPPSALPAPGRGGRFAALVALAKNGASLNELRLASRRVTEFALPPLPAMKRDAEPFESLRRRADLALSRIGSRPPVFLAILGKPDDYQSRANWVQGFFAAGGIEVIVPGEGFDSADALAAVFKQSPAPVACLCSSNSVYASMEGAAAALKTAGAVMVYLAGPPSVLKSFGPQDGVGIDRVIHEGCNALALLQEAQSILRVEELSDAADREALEEGFETYGGAEAQPY
jgi:methylmalonyl-CoA mutase